MKERRVAGRIGDLAVYSDEERRLEQRRRALLESDSSPLDGAQSDDVEHHRVRRLLANDGDWLDALKHRSQAPCKVTRVEREIAIAERSIVMNPDAALAYSQRMLAVDRGGPGSWASHPVDDPVLGALASLFADQDQGPLQHDDAERRAKITPQPRAWATPLVPHDELAARRRASDSRAGFPQARLAARELPGHHAGLSDQQSEAQLDEVLTLLRTAGSGAPLPEAVAARMEGELGRSFAHVRIHLDSVAAEACAQLGAQAFTLGNHIYFGAGQFAPDSEDGAGLLRHELTHVVQHGRGELTAHGRAELVSSTSAIEAEARAAEAPKPRPRPTMPAWAGGAPMRDGQGPIARNADDTGAASAPVPAPSAASAGAGLPATGPLALAPASPSAAQGPSAALSTIVKLTGTFAPPANVAAHIAKAGDAGAGVKVAIPGLTKPAIITVKRVDGRYVTVEDKPQLVPLSHPLFVFAGTLAPMLRIRIGESQDNAVTGYVTTGAGDLTAMQSALQGNMAMLGLRGFAVPQLALTNRLADGKLSFGTNGHVDFTLGGWVHGTLSLAMEDRKVSFAARAAIHARGIKDAEITFHRDAKGKISGSAALATELGPHFSGSVKATYANGDITVSGQLGYQSEKLKGKLNVLFADAAQGEAMARGELPADALKSEGAATASGGKRGLAGSGTLDFAFSDWLTGSAKTVFGPTGYLTVIGKIAPPKSVQLMAPKSRKVTLLPKVKIEACYGIPKLLDIHVGVGLGLDAYGVLGPVTMTDLELDGIYSTDPKVRNRFAITGTVRAQAEAGLQLSIDGYAGLNIAFHSINFGATAWGRAALQAYAEARATLGYRETAAPTAGKKGEHYLQGHLEMAAQPVLSFGGGLFIEASGPFVNKRWDWPLGSIQYPLPGQMGIGADIDYVIGSGQVPDVKFSKPAFDATKFTEQLMDGKLPKGSGGARNAKKKFESKTPTKVTQNKLPLQKQQKPKSEITAGASKTQRTAGNQTEEDKKKKPGEVGKAGEGKKADESKKNDAGQKAGAQEKRKDEKAGEGKKASDGKKDKKASESKKDKKASDGKKDDAGKKGAQEKRKGKGATKEKELRLNALKVPRPATIDAKGQLATDIAKARSGQVLFDNGVDAKTATKKILRDHRDSRFDEATGTLTLPPVSPPNPSSPLVEVAKSLARQTGVSIIKVRKTASGVALAGKINPEDVLTSLNGESKPGASPWEMKPLQERIDRAKERMQLLASRGEFTEKRLRATARRVKKKFAIHEIKLTRNENETSAKMTVWDVEIRGEAWAKVEAIRRFSIRVKNVPQETFGAKKGTSSGVKFQGSFAHSKWTWDHYPRGPVTKHPANKYLHYQSYTTLSAIKPPEDKGYKFIGGRSPGAPKGDKEIWLGELERKVKEKIDLDKSDKDSNKKREEAQIKVLNEYKNDNYGQLGGWDDLILGTQRNWQAHHILEHSWGGGDEKSNFQYLALNGEHHQLTIWWNTRRDEIKRALEADQGTSSKDGDTPKKE